MNKKRIIVLLAIIYLCLFAIQWGQKAQASIFKETVSATINAEKETEQDAKVSESKQKNKIKEEKKRKRKFWQKKERNTETVVEVLPEPSSVFVPNIDTKFDVQSSAQFDSTEEKLEIMSSHFKKEMKEQKKKYLPPNESKTPNYNPNASNITIDSDLLEFFPQHHEAIATGNVVVSIVNSGSKLYADKMIHNTDLNTLKGYGNVKMVKDGQIINGDFININLNEENILVEKPTTEGTYYVLNAKEGFIHPGKIITNDGTVTVKEMGSRLYFSPGMGGSIYIPQQTAVHDFYEKEETGLNRRKTVIKARTIHIKSLKDHDEVSIKKATYYYKDKKMFTMPSIDLTTNKSQDFIETNLPEIGSFKNYASYFGPGFVVNVPGGASLKLSPVIQIGRKYADNDFGIGIMGRFHSKNNLTEGMIGTVDDMIVGRGQHRLSDTLRLQYAHNAYMDEWFMGMRMPEYLIQLTDDRTFYIKDLDVNFRNRLSAGYVSDYYANHLGTTRFRWQTQMTRPFYSKWNKSKTIGLNAGLITQTSATVYGTGDFQGVVRGGPYVGSCYKNWRQTISYLQGGQAGDSPMWFDKYMYGKANLVLRETLKINDYVTVGYLASLALLRDNWKKELFTESQFFLALGPEDFKIALGYDPVRERFRVSYILSLKDSEIEIPYEKMIIDDAETLGKKSDETKEKKKKKKKKRRDEL